MKHMLHSAFKGAAEALIPLRASSAGAGGGFRDTGLLSPEEYVAAGDFLVATCPTWSWAVRVVEGQRRSGAA
jgi:ubiquitin-like-conjugating enzyme ATG3